MMKLEVDHGYLIRYKHFIPLSHSHEAEDRYHLRAEFFDFWKSEWI